MWMGLMLSVGVCLLVLVAGVLIRRARRQPAAGPSYDEVTWAEAAAALDPGSEYRGYDT